MGYLASKLSYPVTICEHTYLRDQKNNVVTDPEGVSWCMSGLIDDIGNRKALERPWVRCAAQRNACALGSTFVLVSRRPR